MLTPIEDAWQNFFAMVGHPETPATQKAEMRRVFLAGAMFALGLDTDDDAVFAAVDVEIEAFGAEIYANADLAAATPAGRA